jgi:uncharacterized membrane protein
MADHARIWLLCVVLAGLGASLTSLYVHDHVVRDPAYTSFCNVSQPLDCETFYRSRFATIRGVPTALGEVIWFGLALLLIAGADSGARSEDHAPYVFAIAIPAVSAGLFQTYASVVVLGATSIWCALTYLAVLAVFLTSGASPSAPLHDLPRRLVRDGRALLVRPLALAVVIAFLSATVSAVVFFRRSAGRPTAEMIAALAEQPTDFDLWFESQVRTSVGLTAADARVLIVKFTDYQCAACAESYLAEKSVLGKHLSPSSAVTLVVQDFPQDRECNPHARESHEAACDAAAAVHLARRRQRGAQMEEWLYAHHADLSPAAVREAARVVGGVDNFEDEYPQALSSMQDSVELGRRLSVTRLPTFFINGVRIEGALRPELLDRAIEHELRVTAKR